jgi:hypothetical protein
MVTRLNLGIICAVLVLVPALIGAELVVRDYEHRAIEDLRSRTANGLDSLSATFDIERVRTLNNAEVAGERIGPLVADDMPPDDLLKPVNDVRTNALRSTTLLAIVDGNGHTLESDPASNLPFGTQGDVKGALQGRMSVGWQERGTLAIEAVSALRSAGMLPGLSGSMCVESYANAVRCRSSC